MHEREFTIDANNLELTIYESFDDHYAQSVCENELEIPEECIRKIECYE